MYDSYNPFSYRDLPRVLLELSKEFNIEKFLVVLLDSLIDCRWDFTILFLAVYAYHTIKILCFVLIFTHVQF
jgi:hypothetical protein